MYTECYKVLRKDVVQGVNLQSSVSGSRIGRLNSVKGSHSHLSSVQSLTLHTPHKCSPVNFLQISILESASQGIQHEE